MAASFPTSAHSFTTRSDGVDLNSAADVNALQDEVSAIETDLLKTWTTPAFSAGNFSATGTTTWTVDAGDVETFAYQRHGKTMVVSLVLTSTAIGGTNNATELLTVKIPEGCTAAKKMVAPCLVVNSGNTVGFIEAVASSDTLVIAKDVVASAWAAGVAHIYGQITFEVA
jgi:hypothetical protein